MLGAFLHAVPITACGTRLDDRSLCIAIALRLGAPSLPPVCAEHRCVCGAVIDVSGTHGLSCSKVAGRLARHNAVNELIRRALLTAGILSRLEPTKLSYTYKRPDGGNDYALVTWKVRSVGFYMSGYPRIQSPESGSHRSW